MSIELITTNEKLSTTLLRLIEDHPNYILSVAWASAGTSVFKALSRKRDQIEKAVIGTHFYQTHPDVIDTFIDAPNVRFMLQPSGVFHPKVYAFWNDQKWEVLIGSANLTAGALNKNSEAMVIITGDHESGSVFLNVKSLIYSYWRGAKSVSQADAEAYRALWKKQQSALRRVSGQYGQKDSAKTPLATPMPCPPFGNASTNSEMNLLYCSRETNPVRGISSRASEMWVLLLLIA